MPKIRDMVQNESDKEYLKQQIHFLEGGLTWLIYGQKIIVFRNSYQIPMNCKMVLDFLLFPPRTSPPPQNIHTHMHTFASTSEI